VTLIIRVSGYAALGIVTPSTLSARLTSILSGSKSPESVKRRHSWYTGL